MPLALELHGVNFGTECFYASEEDRLRGAEPALVKLSFLDQQSGIRAVIPFTADAWQNFKRHVAADGKVTAIALARSVPRMDIPRA